MPEIVSIIKQDGQLIGLDENGDPVPIDISELEIDEVAVGESETITGVDDDAIAEDGTLVGGVTAEDLEPLENRTSGLSEDGSEADLESVRTDELNNANVAAADEGDLVQKAATAGDLEFAESLDLEWLHVAKTDDELDDVLEEVTEGDTVLLGVYDFEKDRTGDDAFPDVRFMLEGVSGSIGVTDCTRVEADWEFQDTVHLKELYLREYEIVFNGERSQMTNCSISLSDGLVTVNEDYGLFDGIFGIGTIHYADGAEDGCVGARSARIDVTGNTDDNMVFGG